MATENGDSEGLLRIGGALTIIVGVCLTVATTLLSLMVVYDLGLWQPNLPYLATLASFLPFGAEHPVLVAASVLVLLAILAVVGGAAAIKGNDDISGLPRAGAVLGVIAGGCLAVAGATLALVIVNEVGLWQVRLPYLTSLGALLPVEAGYPLLSGAVVVLGLGVLLTIGGVSIVRMSGVATALEAEALLYGVSGAPANRTESATGSRAAVAPILRRQELPIMSQPEDTSEPAAGRKESATGPGAAVSLESRTRKSRANSEPLDDARLSRAKAGFSTRRVPKEDMRTLVTGDVRPRAGDLVLARVDRLRQHRRLELATGRKARLEQGEEIIIACGNRYAADQFEGFVPAQLGRANLIAAGGVAAIEANRARNVRPATEVTLLGLVGDESGLPLNLASYALPAPEVDGARPPVLAVLGTSMNSGKTTAVSFLCRGLTAAGFKVGYAKLTGTGSGNDFWRVLDSGARTVVDFTDAGLASTYRTPISVLELTSVSLIGHLVSCGCDRIVVEIADGLLQTETSGLMTSSTFRALIDRVVFTAGDAMSAIGGVRMLREHGFEVAGVSGLVTASPLPLREATGACGVAVLRIEDLANPETAAGLLTYSGTQHEIPGLSTSADMGLSAQLLQPDEPPESTESSSEEDE